MLQEFREIEKDNGPEGLLPQNIQDELLSEFFDRLMDLTILNANPNQLAEFENMVVSIHTDTLSSIMFLCRKFIGNDSYTPEYLEFDKWVKCIRYHYGREKVSRESSLQSKLPTIYNILDPNELP